MGLQFGDHSVVLAGVGKDGHIFPVFSRAAHHSRAADVNVFNGLFQRTTGPRNGGFEGVKVHHQQVDGVNAMGCQRLHVCRHIAPCQQAAVYLGVQGLHAAIEHFRKARHLGYFSHRQAMLGQQLGGAAGRKQAYALRVQRARQVKHTGFIRDGK